MSGRGGCACSTGSKCIRGCSCRSGGALCRDGACGCRSALCDNRKASASRPAVDDDGCGCSTGSHCKRGCECRDGGKTCSSFCGCRPGMCENRRAAAIASSSAASVCPCSKTSRCVRCPCRNEDPVQLCSPSCNCSASVCENRGALVVRPSSSSSSMASSRPASASAAALAALGLPAVVPLSTAALQLAALGAVPAAPLSGRVPAGAPSRRMHTRAEGTRPTFVRSAELTDAASEMKKLLDVNVTGKRDAVMEYRGRDIYTGKQAMPPAPHVDHIVETQVLAHAMARANVRPSDPGVKDLRGAVNLEDLSNYNVTAGAINISKGGVFKQWLTGKQHEGVGIRPVALGLQCERFMVRIGQGIVEAYPGVSDAAREARRGGGRVGSFAGVAEQLDTLFEAMDVRDLE